MNKEPELTIEDYQKAKKEVAFLVNVLSQTIPDIVGRALGAVGLMAGKEAARKMPIYFKSSEIQPVLDGIESYLTGGFEITHKIIDENESIVIKQTFGKCVLREVCEIEDIPLGGELCSLFHHHINGMISELTARNFRMNILKTGDTCAIRYSKV
ncbi:MAG: hypothetical protein GY795_12655 [Desulfobacterales bacterium]|nr:hypothetical protein [Desulfobacterales bacterium]